MCIIKYSKWLPDLDINLGSLVIDDESLSERLPEESPSLLVSLYTVYGLLFHMGYLLQSKHHIFVSVMLILYPMWF